MLLQASSHYFGPQLHGWCSPTEWKSTPSLPPRHTTGRAYCSQHSSAQPTPKVSYQINLFPAITVHPCRAHLLVSFLCSIYFLTVFFFFFLCHCLLLCLLFSMLFLKAVCLACLIRDQIQWAVSSQWLGIEKQQKPKRTEFLHLSQHQQTPRSQRSPQQPPLILLRVTEIGLRALLPLLGLHHWCGHHCRVLSA